MTDGFSTLERNILRSKGLTDAQLDALQTLGVSSKGDFLTVGDAATLQALAPDLAGEAAVTVMAWAVGAPAGPSAVAAGSRTVLDTSDAVYCTHCEAKQPKDYSSGDLCTNCGKQAEPTESCYWCGASGPGRFCRSCGATFVATAELELAILLRRDGLAKDAIPQRLAELSTAEKDALWGRVRHARS